MHEKMSNLFLTLIIIIIIIISCENIFIAFAETPANRNQTFRYTCAPAELSALDTATARILSLGEYQRPFPERIAQIPRYCKETKEDLQQISRHNAACLRGGGGGSARQFANVIVYSVKSNMRRYCNMRDKRRIRESLLVGRCINRGTNCGDVATAGATTRVTFSRCLARYIDALQRGKDAQPVTDRIGYACCDYFKLIECFDAVTRADCSARAADLMSTFIRNLFQSIVDLACGDFVENSDRCDRLPAISPLEFATTNNNNNNNNNTNDDDDDDHNRNPMSNQSATTVKTFFLPLIELWNNMIDQND